MALFATNRFAGDGVTTSYEFNFVGKYLARPHVKVYQEDNATKARTPIAITDSNFLNDTTLRNLPVTPTGKTLVIYRDTPKPPLVDFTNGSRFTEYNMDLVARQGLFVAMEAMDAGGPDARQQLLDAVAVAVGLVNDATAAVSDATAAAATAAASALSASTSATQAQVAQVAAEATLANKQDKLVSGTNIKTVGGQSLLGTGNVPLGDFLYGAAAPNDGGGSDGDVYIQSDGKLWKRGSGVWTYTGIQFAAQSAITDLATAINDAQTTATNAASSASAATTSASAAQAAATGASPMKCRVVLVNAASRIVRLERCGGQVITLGGVVRGLPAAGITLTLPATATPQHLYAGWNGSAVVFITSTAPPVFNTTLAQWVNPGNTNYAAVAYVRPDGLATPAQFLRNYYNGPGMSHYSASLSADYTANWDGTPRQLMTLPILLLPGDTIIVQGLANIMSTPSARTGDLTIVFLGSTLGRARHKHTGENWVWHNYYCMSNTVQRFPDDAPSQVAFELWYTPVSADGSTWSVLGDGASTKLIVNITPYKWA